LVVKYSTAVELPVLLPVKAQALFSVHCSVYEVIDHFIDPCSNSCHPAIWWSSAHGRQYA